MVQSDYKTVVICIFNVSQKEELLILVLEIWLLIPAIEQVNITIIHKNVYCANFREKKAQLFILFMPNLQYSAEKKAR